MMISRIELAICERLRRGMGRMVRDVESYGGQMDGEPQEIIRQLPAIWVTFGGIQQTENTNVTRNKYTTHGRFVVIVGDRNLRSEPAARMGGPHADEVGTYRLVHAVRRLLSGQDMDLPIGHFVPGRVRTLFNTQVEAAAMSVFACEFDTKWIEHALENGRYPLEDAPEGHPDHVFTPYRGQTSPDDPQWLDTRLQYNLTNSGSNPDAEDIIKHDSD
ncbi:DUF1834 family protein [Shigella sonnei]|nr:DUF1834 family protein [Escherichia coli]EFW5532220.1 DUF1834 family protein [Shigella sonnei]EFZ0655782.1 DUF1834 family protein [Shigella sonnei]EFZ2872825.1 DUF1834 family protein [Shigella sonnei]EFZ3697889.1 DUF1834 family protein [Shigella sonnei]